MATSVKTMSVAHTNTDITFKVVTETFQDKVLNFYGLHVGRIKSIERTELADITVQEKRLDFVFRMEDDSYLHLEFQTTVGANDLERFLQYDVALYNKKRKPIMTVVIYGKEIDKAPTRLDLGSVLYQTSAVFMNEYDGDARYEELRMKIERHEELSEEDQLTLIFLPLMRTSIDRAERALKTAELAAKIENEEKQKFVIACILAFSDKFVDQEDTKQFLEVLKMTNLMRYLEEEHRRKSEAEAQQARIDQSHHVIELILTAKFQDFAKRIQEQVLEIRDLEVLDRIITEISQVNTITEAEQVIKNAHS